MKTPRLKSTARKAKATLAKVPGPSNNPATNLLIFDIALRGATMLIGRTVEKGLLRTRYHGKKAGDIVEGRSWAQSLTATGAARLATRSVPGFLLVTGGLLAKAVIDRGFSRRQSVRRGERQLAEQAEQAGDDEA